MNFTGLGPVSFSQSVDQVKGLTDNFSIFMGKHQIKAGVLFNQSDNFSSPATPPPSFSFTGRSAAGSCGLYAGPALEVSGAR